jgi:predicted amidohydrolase
MRIAAAAYPMDMLPDWAAYEAKIARWFADARADLLVFPEYAAMELATLDGPQVAADLEASLWSVAAYRSRMEDLFARQCGLHGCYALTPSGPVDTDDQARPVNRATLVGPQGVIGHQDKQVMTRFEREAWSVVSGGPLRVFDLGGVTVGVLICYDAEFAQLGRALVEAGAQVILVPSCTDGLGGYWRVRIGAMARALEGQCIVAQAPTVGACDWSPAVDENVGAAAIYGPPDLGFPPTGVLAQGAVNAAGWVRADADLQAIAAVRRDGQVLNLAHWPEAQARARTE